LLRFLPKYLYLFDDLSEILAIDNGYDVRMCVLVSAVYRRVAGGVRSRCGGLGNGYDASECCCFFFTCCYIGQNSDRGLVIVEDSMEHLLVHCSMA
jgi:hypothetical protein